MKRIALTAAASILLAWAPMTNAQEALAKGAGCLNCHSPDVKKVGPSFKDTAAKYKGKPEAEAMLVAKLADAKQHPATKAKPDDLKSLVKWILAM
jgi:cytochrome c